MNIVGIIQDLRGRVTSTSTTVIGRVPLPQRVRCFSLAIYIGRVLIIVSRHEIEHVHGPLLSNMTLTRNLNIRRRGTDLRMVMEVLRLRRVLNVPRTLTVLSIRINGRISVSGHARRLTLRINIMRLKGVTVSSSVQVRVRRLIMRQR